MKRYLVTCFLLVLIGGFFWTARTYLIMESKNSKPSLASIDHFSGKVFFKNAQSEIAAAVPLQKIYENESLMTDHDSTLFFHLASGANFEMAPFSKIVFEESGNQASPLASITILEGQIQLLSEPTDNDSFEVTKKGQALSLSELKIAIPKNAQPQETPTAQKSQPEKKLPAEKGAHAKIVKSGNTLDEDDINQVMHNQTSFLHRCYINYMLRTQKLDLSGQVVLSFLIEPTGKVKNTKIVSSPAQDHQLDRCLTDVIDRASFKEFSSQPIFVQAYPIHLE